MMPNALLSRHAILALPLLAMLVGAVRADPLQITCDGADVTVAAATRPQADAVCHTVQAALPRLHACHLPLRRPLLLTVSDDLPGVGTECLGYYRSDRSEIFIRTPQGMTRTMGAGSAFGRITPDLFFESIVVHELAHALFQQNINAAEACTEDHEYVAHAMQLAWLPANERAHVVDAYRTDAPVDPMVLNAFIAAMAPDRYAALVWQHFSHPRNGCAYIQRLVDGETSLYLPVFPD